MALSVTGKKDDYQTCHHPLEDYWNWARHTAMMSEYSGVQRHAHRITNYTREEDKRTRWREMNSLNFVQ